MPTKEELEKHAFELEKTMQADINKAYELADVHSMSTATAMYQDFANAWLIAKMAELELRLKRLEGSNEIGFI